MRGGCAYIGPGCVWHDDQTCEEPDFGGGFIGVKRGVGGEAEGEPCLRGGGGEGCGGKEFGGTTL